MNYTYARNPERLVGLLTESYAHTGSSRRVHNAKEEKRFLEKLHGLGREALGDLTVIVGGFMDGLTGNAYNICANYPPELRAGQDVYYRQHQEGAAVRELVELYRHRGRHVTLIGHSWGGDAVVHAVSRQTRACIHMLVTLDPVSRKPIPNTKPINVRRWHNVHVDYTRATWLNQSNNVARIGRPWEAVPCAHVNKVVDHTVPHAAARHMFDYYMASDMKHL